MTLKSAGDSLLGLEALEGRLKWVACPFCGDEVMKLRPCVYWNGTEQVSHVCSECAESVKGLTFLAVNYPIPGVDVIRDLMPVYKKLPQKHISERSFKADVVYGKWGFTVWLKGGKLFALEKLKSPDQEKSYDNTFQVWFALKNIFENGEREEQKTLLGRGKDRRSGWAV